MRLTRRFHDRLPLRQRLGPRLTRFALGLGEVNEPACLKAFRAPLLNYGSRDRLLQRVGAYGLDEMDLKSGFECTELVASPSEAGHRHQACRLILER